MASSSPIHLSPMHSKRSHRSGYWVSGWPELVAQWHPTRNGSVRPEDLPQGSGRKVWWKCRQGPDHEWVAKPNNRTTGRTGCPFCTGHKVSVTNSLASIRPDLAKQWHPTRNGALTPDGIVAGSTKCVWWNCPVAPDHEWRVSPHDRAHVEGGCPFCVGRRVSETNSLATRQPTLAAEWHPTKNGKLGPGDVAGGSGRLIWWRCGRHRGHEWRASVSNRSRGSGCPFCAGKKASAQHCLAIAHPAIAAEWHPTRNGSLTPESVTPRAPREVWWRCAKGHDWQAQVVARTRRLSPCPACPRHARQRGPKAAAWNFRNGGTVSAVGYVREQHREIEQVLTLLAGDACVDRATIARVIAGIAAHLRTEEIFLYPIVERVRSRPLAKERELHTQMHLLISKLPASRVGGRRTMHLKDLEVAFREHARLVERAALPWLDGALSPASQETLRRQLSGLQGSGRMCRAASDR